MPQQDPIEPHASSAEGSHTLAFRAACAQGLSAPWLLFAFCLALLLMFSRAPALLLHAQFYAEDGIVWYGQAYNLGWLHSLTLPEGGYLNTLQRLVAGPILLVPLRDAPSLMAWAGLLLEVLPIPILLSSRCRTWANLPTRCLFAALYVALPNSREVHVVLTNAQWHLAVMEALLLFAAPPVSWKGRLLDGIVFLVGGFSGPFCLIFLPFALVWWWKQRTAWTLAVTSFMVPGSCVQLYELLFHSARYHAPLGASPALFLQMTGRDVLACALLGGRGLSPKIPTAALLVALAGALVLFAYCLRFAPLGLKLFLVFCGTLFAASLRSPLIMGPRPLWNLLTEDVGARYWFFPMLAFLWAAAWCALNAPLRLFRVTGASLCIVSLVGIVQDWRYPGYMDANFPQSVHRFEQAPIGTPVAIPILPDGRVMVLIKKHQTHD